jgi:uncharacterized CHY-type Zn-finger protein
MGVAGCNPNSQLNQEHLTVLTESEHSHADTVGLIPVNTFSSDYFPCNDCHSEIPSNARRRELVEMHDDILYDHDSENRWCLACHSETNRDSLVLAGGKLLSFNESYRLCGQCHGPKYSDWRLGIHGKRTGSWNGQKEYHLCVDCHDPHSPKIKKLQPMPPPRRPEQIKIDSIYERPEENETLP